MKLLAVAILFCLLTPKFSAQSFCFYDPNPGPFYSNGSSGAIYDITGGDFNSDGYPDIVTANSVASDISFIPGNGDGTLGTPDTTSLSGVLFCITSADFNNDNLLDIATTDGVELYVLFGNGDGTFQSPITYPSVGSPSRIYALDINNDDISDLLIAASGGACVFIGQIGGSFLPYTLYPTGGGDLIDLCLADFDNDGIQDVMATTHLTPTTSELSFMKGNGDGTFASNSSVLSLSYPDHSIAGIDASDFDGDGHMDVAVANSSSGRIEIYFGDGEGMLDSPVFYDTQNNPFYLYLSDFDNDSVVDVAVEEGNGFSILHGNPDGTFNPYQSVSAVSAPNSLTVDDFNADGKLDVIAPSAYFGSPLIAVRLGCTTTSIHDQPSTVDPIIEIFPNPCTTQTTLRLNTFIENGELELYNNVGQKIKAVTGISGIVHTLHLNGLSRGLYFLRLTENNRLLATEKIIVVD